MIDILIVNSFCLVLSDQSCFFYIVSSVRAVLLVNVVEVLKHVFSFSVFQLSLLLMRRHS